MNRSTLRKSAIDQKSHCKHLGRLNLDTLNSGILDKAFITGGVVYATARGIHAAVSVVQGTELDALVATITIGEILDPLNDLVERFSAVLLAALGSLALQKILLDIISSSRFSYLLVVIGMAAFAIPSCLLISGLSKTPAFIAATNPIWLPPPLPVASG